MVPLVTASEAGTEHPESGIGNFIGLVGF